MKTEMSYEELMNIWAPLHDASTMTASLREKMGGFIRDEFMNELEAKLDSSCPEYSNIADEDA